MVLFCRCFCSSPPASPLMPLNPSDPPPLSSAPAIRFTRNSLNQRAHYAAIQRLHDAATQQNLVQAALRERAAQLLEEEQKWWSYFNCSLENVSLEKVQAAGWGREESGLTVVHSFYSPEERAQFAEEAITRMKRRKQQQII